MDKIYLPTTIQALKGAGLWGVAINSLSASGLIMFNDSATEAQKTAVQEIVDVHIERGAPPDSEKEYVYQGGKWKEINGHFKSRQFEYPPMVDYLDGVAKASSSNPVVKAEGEAQIAQYCADCLAVKAKYPKSE